MVTINRFEEVPYERDLGAPAPYRGGVHHFSVGADLTHAVAFELEPGQAVCPYHYEYGHELWAVVLEGQVTVRTPEGFQELATGDVMFAARGTDGTHQLINKSEGRVRILGFSNFGLGASFYPDSEKVGVWTPFEGEDFIGVRSTGVGYFHGERDLHLMADD